MSSVGGSSLAPDRYYAMGFEVHAKEKPSWYERCKLKFRSRIRPDTLARGWSASGEIERRHPDEFQSISGRAVKRFSSNDVQRMKPEQVQTLARKGHLRKWSSGRISVALPKLEVGMIDCQLMEERFQNFDDYYRFGLKLTEEHKAEIFGEDHRKLLDGETPFTEKQLKRVQNMHCAHLRLTVVMVSHSTNKGSRVGQLVMAMTPGQRKKVIPFLKSEELAYAINGLPFKEAEELYAPLGERWRYNIDNLLDQERRKALQERCCVDLVVENV